MAYCCRLGDRLPLVIGNRPGQIVLVGKELGKCPELVGHCLFGFEERSAGVVIIVLQGQILYSVNYYLGEVRGFLVSFDY